MELAEYLGRIWRRKWIVLIVTVFFVVIDISVVYALPRYYRATSILEVGGIQSLLGNPGQQSTRETSRQTLPSAIQAITQKYLNILATPVVNEKAKERVGTRLAYVEQPGRASEDGNSVPDAVSEPGVPGVAINVDFSYEGRAEAVRGSSSDIIYIDVRADDPAVAKAAADVLATVLVEQSQKIGGNIASDFVRNIEDQQIVSINRRLVAIREESETLKYDKSIDDATRGIRIANLQDEAAALLETRKQYTDIIATVRVNEALGKNDLKVISQASLPDAKEAPPLIQSSAVAGIVGLLISLLAVIIIDRRASPKPATLM